MNRYFQRVSIVITGLIWFTSCSNIPYSHLSFTPTSLPHISHWQPELEIHKYRCIIDGRFLWKDYHLSGVLLIKKMPDENIRMVFQNEMGLSFFDFNLSKDDGFEVIRIIPQMNKTALITTLEKLFKLIFVRGIDFSEATQYVRGDTTITQFAFKDKPVYYTAYNSNIVEIINTSARKKVITIAGQYENSNKQLPRKMEITGHKAHFTITLNSLTDEPAEK